MMKKMFLCIVMLSSTPILGFSQEVEWPSSLDLSQTLVGLKKSEEALTNTNAQLERDNAGLQADIAQLQMKLAQLSQQHHELTKMSFKLQDKDESKAKQIALAQQELFQLESQVEHQSTSLNQLRERLAKIKQEDVNLNDQLNQIQNVRLEPIVEPVENPGDELKRKEKINLLKMIDQSQARQQELNKQLLALKPSGPQEDVAQLLAQREILQTRIQDVQGHINASGHLDVKESFYGSGDIQVLSQQMTALEKNYDQLRLLWEKMQQKAQSLGMNQSQRAEKNKLEKNLEELSRESQVLKAQLQGLREQMVELDKRKTRLQNLLAQ